MARLVIWRRLIACTSWITLWLRRFRSLEWVPCTLRKKSILLGSAVVIYLRGWLCLGPLNNVFKWLRTIMCWWAGSPHAGITRLAISHHWSNDHLSSGGKCLVNKRLKRAPVQSVKWTIILNVEQLCATLSDSARISPHYAFWNPIYNVNINRYMTHFSPRYARYFEYHFCGTCILMPWPL